MRLIKLNPLSASVLDAKSTSWETSFSSLHLSVTVAVSKNILIGSCLWFLFHYVVEIRIFMLDVILILWEEKGFTFFFLLSTPVFP